MRTSQLPRLARPVLSAALVLLALVVVPRPADASPTAAAFVPVTPCRVLDTRMTSRVAAGTAVEVDLGGCVLDAASAVSITVAVVNPTSNGYAVAYAANATRPTTSNVNFVAGDVVANGAVVAVDDNRIEVWSSATTHVLVDVTGYFAATGDGTARAGRFVGVTPTRVYDSRQVGERPAPGSELSIVLPGVPAGASAAAVTITTAATRGRGFFTVWGGGERPRASVLNHDARRVRAATVFTEVAQGAGGTASIEVFTSSGEHVIVDLVGWFTGPDADVSSDGLFIPIEANRLVDTRDDEVVYGGYPIEVDPGAGYGALIGNLTLVRAEQTTWAAVRAAGVPNDEPDTASVSAVNWDGTASASSNLAVTRLSDRGLQVFTPRGTDVVVDATGYFTGDPLPAVDPVPQRTPPWSQRRVTIVSDSAFAGVRWNNATSALRGAQYTTLLESCRRLVIRSCFGREGYRPPSALEEIERLPRAGVRDMLVVATGYNDWVGRFAEDVELIMAAARERGFRHVAWLTLRTDSTYQPPGSNGADRQANYRQMNTILRDAAASGRYPELMIWDRDAYTSAAPSDWFSADGVHQRPLGSFGMADWVSRQVAAFDGRPCPAPLEPGQPADEVCDTLNVRPIVYPNVAALYG